MAPSPDLPDLEAKRRTLHAELVGIGDFRPGSLSAVMRRCGKANCVCANPGHPGHGPRHLLTKKIRSNGKTRAVQLNAGAELEKANREVAKYKQFQATVTEIVAVSEAICARHPTGLTFRHYRQRTPSPETVTDPEKGGSAPSSARRSRRR